MTTFDYKWIFGRSEVDAHESRFFSALYFRAVWTGYALYHNCSVRDMVRLGYASKDGTVK
jgi:hypothetical protein